MALLHLKHPDHQHLHFSIQFRSVSIKTLKMQFTALALLGMATAATCTAIPEIFERSPLCVVGPKHAGDECHPSNWNAKTCGPGNDGNIVSWLRFVLFGKVYHC